MNPRHPYRSFLVAAIVALFAILGAPTARAAEPPPTSQTSEQTPPAGEQKPGAQSEKPAARREDIEPATLTDAKTALGTARADRDKAETDLKAAEELLATTAADLGKANAEITSLKDQLGKAEVTGEASGDRLAALTSLVKSALGLTDEQVENLASDATIIPTAIESLATRKAVDIAARQGVPPVRTEASGKGTPDDIKADFEAASKEPDPRKRGAMFAAASKRLAASVKAPGN